MAHESENKKKGIKSAARHEKNLSLLLEEKWGGGVVLIQNWGMKATEKGEENTRV